jgi:hypothetical protein
MTLLAAQLAVVLLGESLLQLLAFTALVRITAMTALLRVRASAATTTSVLAQQLHLRLLWLQHWASLNLGKTLESCNFNTAARLEAGSTLLQLVVYLLDKGVISRLSHHDL